LNTDYVTDVRHIGTHTTEPLVPGLRLKLLLQTLKIINHHLVITFWQSLFKQEVKHCSLGSTNASISLGTRKKCLVCGRRNLLLYQFTKRVIKLTVVIVVRCHFSQLGEYPSHSQVHAETKLLGNISVDFEATG
jgi:hypothetical protein